MPADAVALAGKITAVKGTVQVRNGDSDAWKAATVGMAVDQGTEIRTGLRSVVQFVVGSDQTITLDRLGTMTVLQAFQSRGKAKTDLGLKYGRAQYDIQHTDLEHESTIRSPGSTLAIRGTNVVYEDQAPWVPSAVCSTGRAEFRNYRRQFLAFGGKRPAQVAADKNSPAETAYSNTKADPKGAYAGRTGSEDALTLTLQPIGGVDARGLQAIQDLAKLSGFQNTFGGVVPVEGPLRFNVTWFSTTAGAPSDLNLTLTLTDLLGNTSVASAASPTIGSGSSTGTHSGDDRGGTGSGAEEVAFPQFFPSGTYTMKVDEAGPNPARAQVTIFRGPTQKVVKSIGVAPDPPLILQPGESFSTSVKIRAKSK
jgi:hypothetical protein